jgi:hypothetical protein
MNPSPSSTPSKPALNNAMPADLVMSYLKKEGYTATEEVFLKELNGIPVNLSSGKYHHYICLLIGRTNQSAFSPLLVYTFIR